MPLKPCMIWTHRDRGLVKAVSELATAAGFDRMDGAYDGLVFGKWFHHSAETTVLQGQWEPSLWNQHPDWPRFDAATEMDKIKAHFSGEPEFDESPLPYDMDKDKAIETQRKFNLSPDQWEVLPPMAREALAGTPVEVVQSVKNWKPVNLDDVAIRRIHTVLLTDSPSDAIHDAADHVRVGYYEIDGEFIVYPGGGKFKATHYCSLPDRMEDGSNLEDLE